MLVLCYYRYLYDNFYSFFSPTTIVLLLYFDKLCSGLLIRLSAISHHLSRRQGRIKCRNVYMEWAWSIVDNNK